MKYTQSDKCLVIGTDLILLGNAYISLSRSYKIQSVTRIMCFSMVKSKNIFCKKHSGKISSILNIKYLLFIYYNILQYIIYISTLIVK